MRTLKLHARAERAQHKARRLTTRQRLSDVPSCKVPGICFHVSCLNRSVAELDETLRGSVSFLFDDDRVKRSLGLERGSAQWNCAQKVAFARLTAVFLFPPLLAETVMDTRVATAELGWTAYPNSGVSRLLPTCTRMSLMSLASNSFCVEEDGLLR